MNNRSAQVVAATLAFLLIVLVGVTIFIALSRPAVPGPTPTPSGHATAGPSFTPTPGPSSTGAPLPTSSGTALPTFSFPVESPTPIILPTDTPSPTLEPTITPTPSPSPTPSPAPTPSPTLPPSTSPQREVTVVDIGLDQRSDIAGVQRTISFFVDGPSLISARLSNVNAGKVRMCLLRNDQEPQKECINVHEGTLSRAVFDAGQSEWNVTLLGTSGVAGQFGSLTLEFNALSPDIRLDSFRFNGTDNPHYNGFTVVFGTGADGTFRLRAQIDDGHDNPYQWHLNVAVDDVPVYDNTAGPDTSVDQSVAVSGGTAYTVLFEEPEASAGGGLFPVFVDARLTWP